MNEKGFWVRNGKMITEIVASIEKPSEKHLDKVWIEMSPEECESQLQEMKMEYVEINC